MPVRTKTLTGGRTMAKSVRSMEERPMIRPFYRAARPGLPPRARNIASGRIVLPPDARRTIQPREAVMSFSFFERTRRRAAVVLGCILIAAAPAAAQRFDYDEVVERTFKVRPG